MKKSKKKSTPLGSKPLGSEPTDIEIQIINDFEDTFHLMGRGLVGALYRRNGFDEYLRDKEVTALPLYRIRVPNAEGTFIMSLSLEREQGGTIVPQEYFQHEK